jgi:hypothetical protein
VAADTSGAGFRYGALALALVAGLILALAALPAAHPWLDWHGGNR